MIPTREEMRRALEARHGVQLQARFDGGRVAICGLGGLGSNIAIALIELSADNYSTHGYVLDLKEQRSHDFDRLYAQFADKYKI